MLCCIPHTTCTLGFSHDNISTSHHSTVWLYCMHSGMANSTFKLQCYTMTHSHNSNIQTNHHNATLSSQCILVLTWRCTCVSLTYSPKWGHDSSSWCNSVGGLWKQQHEMFSEQINITTCSAQLEKKIRFDVLEKSLVPLNRLSKKSLCIVFINSILINSTYKQLEEPKRWWKYGYGKGEAGCVV